MRAYKRYNNRGFTLVELMIVVAIIGVLAALAIYGVTRYLASAKTSEAKNTVGAIARGASGAYERESAASEILGEGDSSTAPTRALCASADAVPDAVTEVANTKYQPVNTDGNDFQSGTDVAGWKCLKFSMTQPIAYMYDYNAGSGYVTATVPGAPAPTGDGFEAIAQGDIDGDTVVSTFARTGSINTTSRELNLSTQVFINNEFE
ncbi:uncharacterized protein SOCE26_052950 [Sorangium cellulosum]|uniref:Fimbiral protein pilA n=1 Tax=Sorangium cellulosum TaxID=56 RepID=A0A2L0EX66_SORCE|nr:prepilin-type N-terminal cleavage/methylation domain-containing protein [Sorangium cellulosum]AUX43839.1 uncharacterized protein SOCE26_052950 [Sorangium cellulosum]